MPLLSSVAWPRTWLPSLKVTVPVGVPWPLAMALTVAVRVADWPKTAGLAEALSATVDCFMVAGAVTFCARLALLAMKF